AWNARLCDLLDQSADALHFGLGHTDFLRMLATRGLLGAGDPEALVDRRAGELRAGHMLRNHEIVVGGRHLEVSEFAMPNGGHVATFTDVTDRREAEQLLFKQATTDELTGLPHRVVGIDRLHTAVAQAKRSGMTVGVLFVDLDGFKRVNDTLGHAAGDALLQDGAHRMEGCLRESDTIARLGGDEFLVLVPQIARRTESVAVAEKLIGRLVEPFRLDGQDIFISCSIGISHFAADGDGDGDDAEALLRNADIAMYEAKAAGRNTYQHHSPQLNEEAQRRLEIETAFRRAIDNDELYLDYQPIVDAIDGRLIGAEALLRWNRPGVGLVRPDQFIPLIETTNLILPTGEWVLRQACRDAAHWGGATGRQLLVAVNVSARQFRDPDFVDTVKSILDDAGLPPTALRIELTETLLVQDPPRAREVLTSLKKIDVGIAMDDFGTGYSSLGYIKDFPFDTIKLDKSFVSGILTSHEDRAITRAVLAMADSLKLHSVAEGVETPEQLDFLRGHGCTYAQGFLFGKPEASEFLLRRAGDAAAGLATAAR
ncbi:MAG: EAL domain-containing protein, partial [Pseudomonadota bacterium]